MPNSSMWWACEGFTPVLYSWQWETHNEQTCVGVYHVWKAGFPSLLLHLFPPCWPASRARVEHHIQIENGDSLTDLQTQLFVETIINGLDTKLTNHDANG